MRDDQRREIAGVLLKLGAVALGIGLVIGLGTLGLVKGLGLGGGSKDGGARTVASADGTPSSLPSVALDDPSGSPSPSAEPTSKATKAAKPKRRITLGAAPERVGANQRINLTGSYPGAAGRSLQVQRKEAGRWSPFADVRATVNGGSFATYVLTGRTGKNVFRVWDPTTSKGSNPVTVTVG